MVYDIVIVGSGPAGLCASIYAARAQKTVLVIEKEAFGGMISHSPKVENYPGFPIISGIELADKFVEQAMNLGVNFEFDEINGIVKEEQGFTVCGLNGIYLGKTVIIATGTKHRNLQLDKEEDLIGNGISYCAVCDGPFYSNQDVMIVGGGNSAMQEAILLSSYCTHVTMIQNLGFLTGEQALIDQIAETKNISVLYNKVVVQLKGEDNLNAIVIEDQVSKELTLLETNSLFVAIGQQPNNYMFKDVCDLDDIGFIVSDELCNTKVDGIFVAGDCRQKHIRQVSTAIADGSIAAMQAIKFLNK